MSAPPLLSMCLIARDEEHNVERCFDGFWRHVDEVVLVDTGSKDDTVKVAREYAARRRGRSKLRVARVAWSDDFAAARSAADALATGRWLTWCDLDDEIAGLDRLRAMAEQAADEVVAFFCRYEYARDADGNCISELWRERVVRSGAADWTGRLHEHKLLRSGTIVHVDPRVAQWVHRREIEPGGQNERNLRILERWRDAEPDDPRVLSSLGLEYTSAGRAADAADVFASYLTCPGEPADRRCQAARYMCAMLLQQGRAEEARAAALATLAEDALWPDTYLTLAECAQTLGRPAEGYRHAQTALEIGKPQTLLIVNPLQYTVHARALMAICAAQQGRFDEAVGLADEALGLAPGYELVAQNAPLWRGHLRREQTIATWANCADVLVEAGELAKARRLYDAVPHFAVDDPRVIDRRAALEWALRDAHARAPVALREGPAAEYVARRLEREAA